MSDEELQIIDELRHQIADLQRENDRLAEILGMQSSAIAIRPEISQSVDTQLHHPLFHVDRTAPVGAKVEFFQSLFVGRDDVYALRWESARTGKHGWSPAVQGGFANIRSPSKDYLMGPDIVF